MSHLSVTTIVPTHNRSQLLGRALGSAVPECGPDDEIIVVDDGSTDDTEAVVEAFGPPVRYMRTPHLGAGAARNAGIAAATGDLVAFLDSDDEWLPDKLARQRAVLERFPSVLWVFSDFGSIGPSGDRGHHREADWKQDDPRPWDEILGPALSSETMPGLPAGTPPFNLYVGSLFETYIWSWCVFTSTVVARREGAGDALRFAEDVPTYEDLECYGRLAGRGLAGFMDCETAMQGHQASSRLSHVDPVTHSDAATKVIARVWGEDQDYLGAHRKQYEAFIDSHRARKIHHLLGWGRRREARQELALCYQAPRLYTLSAHVPGRVMKLIGDIGRRSRRRS